MHYRSSDKKKIAQMKTNKVANDAVFPQCYVRGIDEGSFNWNAQR